VALKAIATATVSNIHQITIPKAVREKYTITPGSSLVFMEDTEKPGRIIILTEIDD